MKPDMKKILHVKSRRLNFQLWYYRDWNRSGYFWHKWHVGETHSSTPLMLMVRYK